ncbi:MAG: NTP transferase domain-containing protein [Sphingomonas sp.]
MIDTAILLAAGEGSRLRPAAPFKPLCRVAGNPLIAHAISGLATASMRRVVVVLGYGADEIEAWLAGQAWPIAVETVRTEDYRKPNGSSLLAAEQVVGKGEALLAMCDHLVEPSLYRHVAAAGAAGGATLGIDRHLANDWVDLDDVTRVESAGDRIVAIGKGLAAYDCYDTGVFAIGPALFAALHTLDAPSLTEGMRILAQTGDAHITDCGALKWIDVDDAIYLAKAEAWLASSGHSAKA